MRIVIADCSVIYTGRGDTKLNRAVRAIITKADGAVSVHCDKSNKPLNYMSGPKTVFTQTSVGPVTVWTFENRNENLTVRIHEIITDTEHPLAEIDEGLQRDGTENHLQEWLAGNPAALGDGFSLVQREYRTGDGAVDLLVRDSDGSHVAVEVKRVAMLGAVGQTQRYVDALNEVGTHGTVRGMIAALDIRPKTAALAAKRGIECVTVDAAWNGRETGAEPIGIFSRSTKVSPVQDEDELFPLEVVAAVG